MAATPLAVLAEDIVPHAGEQRMPFWVTVQFTPLFVPSFFTVAVNCCLPDRATFADPGDIDSEICGRVSRALAELAV